MNRFEFPKFDETDETLCPVLFCENIINLAIDNTTTSCTFAREGSLQLKKIIKDIEKGNTLTNDYELLVDLSTTISKNTKCEIMKEATKILLEIFSEFEDDFDKHMKRGICKNLVCESMYNVYIDPNHCTGCGDCKEICPSILGNVGMIHIVTSDDIDKQTIINCCKFNAIKKYGQIKPKVPLEPILVGTFSIEESGGRKRKKRKSES